MSFGISIVIPTWNGLDLLRRYLPSVLAAEKHYRSLTGAPTEVIVVDDGSEDETVKQLPLEFQEVRLLPRRRNGGFARACNTGIQEAKQPLVALLNNDVRLEEDYLVHMAENFSDPRVFAVTARVFEGDPLLFATGGKVGRFRRGFWSVYFNYDLNPGESERKGQLLSAYAVGGFATYDRQKLLELNGFREILSPFHWEDVDLSYRGWKRGWKVLYEPRSVAHHQISATINRHYRPRKVETVARRNRLLFHWMNLDSASFISSHFLMLFVLLLSRILVLDWSFYQAFAGALVRWRQAIQCRREERPHWQLSDAQLASQLNSFLKDAPVTIYHNRQEVIEKHHQSPRRQAGGHPK